MKKKKHPLTIQALSQYFQEGCKKERDFCVGVEWEKIGIYQQNGEAIPYSGKRGVLAILKALIHRYGWRPVDSDGAIIALKKKNASITLEPGGQIELSGQKARFLDENAAELFEHLDQIKSVSEPLGIAWLGIGMQPMSPISRIEWVPKKRYVIMRESLKNRGHLTYAMMKQTASIQVSLDYKSKTDAALKLRLAMGLSPLLIAMFANSPISDGRLNGYYSKRAHIWRHTAPERTGTPRFVFENDFTLEEYIDYALSLPLLFIVRGNRWIRIQRKNFRQFMQAGHEGLSATLDDWKLHLSTIFTDARLKQYVEIRSIDCQRRILGLSVPALLKGIFYDDEARKNAWSIVAKLSFKKRFSLSMSAAKRGVHAQFSGHALQEPCSELISLASGGLKRLTEKGLAKKDEFKYLEPMRILLEHCGQSPAEVFAECFAQATSKKEKLAKILRCAAI